MTNAVLMLILNVKMQWLSTHQMLCEWPVFNLIYSSHVLDNTGHALDYQQVIDNFVGKTWDLGQFELSPEDWEAIRLVTNWLEKFQSATIQMSATKHATLSSIHAIFRGLQEQLQEDIASLPQTTPSRLCTTLINAHLKLSDYYYKFDQSPYYIWASCQYAVSDSVLGY